MNPKKIMLFKIGALGDVLMTTPFVRQLRKAFPRAEIVYYVGKYAADVLQGNKNIDRVEIFDQNIFYKKNAIRALSLRNKIRKERFDVAFVFDKHWSFGLFIKLCGIPARIGFNRNGEGKYHTHSIIYQQVQHEVHYYLSLLEAIGIKPNNNDTQLDLPLAKKDLSFADKFFKAHKLKGKIIGIVPGGGKNPGEKEPIRRWAIEKMMELVRRLSENHKILLIGGPEDVELCENIIIFLKSKNIISAAGKASRKQSATLMKKCSVIVCGDSGPMHIASAVNNRIVSLFGPTNPKRKAPLHKESIAIWHDQDIYEEDYELYGRLPDLRKRWMTKITVKEVEEAVRKLLHR